jgi:UDP-glucose 4-epimerase
MRKTILITGGFGFLGRAVAKKFQRLGWRVVGLGRGRWAPEDALKHGFNAWLDANVSLDVLMTLRESFDIVVHCAGNGSVGFSLTNPLQDFQKTVEGTVELLEYLRLTGSKALLVYPSSAGVYGAKDDSPIKEDDVLNPISPYGYHKKIAEELLESYSRTYGIRVAIVRFFSIYGAGLTKQLLWDAGLKLRAARGGAATFWGTGDETRDWISSEDAAELIVAATRSDQDFLIVNGGAGERTTVRHTLELLRSALDVDTEVRFNDIVREGDPRFYHADISEARALDWAPSMTLEQGIDRYAAWLLSHKEQGLD